MRTWRRLGIQFRGLEAPPELVVFANRTLRRDPPLPLLDDRGAPAFLQVLDEQLTTYHASGDLLLPDLREAESVTVLSDYGGEHKEAQYRTYSFLFTASDFVLPLLEGVREIRERHRLEIEIAFKERRFGPLRRALPEILNLVDRTPGLLFTLAVDRKVTSIIDRNSREGARRVAEAFAELGVAEWDRDRYEKVARILHCCTYFLGLLGRDGHRVFWMTDHDAIAAGERQQQALLALLAKMAGQYGPRRFDRFGFTPPFLARADRPLAADVSELLAAADLAAGAICELLGDYDAAGELRISERSESIARWLARPTLMQKLVVRITPPRPGAPKDSIWSEIVQLRLAGPEPGAMIIPLIRSRP